MLIFEDKPPIPEVLAQAVVDEFHFPEKMEKHIKDRLVKNLCDAPPTRDQLKFQTCNRMPSAKMQFAEAEAKDDEEYNSLIEELYCMAHQGFMPKGAIALDHAHDFSDFIKRQAHFLEFLNHQPKEYADKFLSCNGISDYFGRDVKDNTIKGTSFFYKVCYNDVDNLWLLCTDCNGRKLNKDFQEWIKEIAGFGEKFLLDISVAGGIYDGLILRRVGKAEPGRAFAVKFFDSSDLSKKPVTSKLFIPQTHGIGLGKFARDWYLKVHAVEFALHKDFYYKHYGQFRSNLNAIRLARQKDDFAKFDELTSQLRKEMITLDGTRQGMADAAADGSSPSGPDSKSDEELRLRAQAKATADTNRDLRKTKKAKRVKMSDARLSDSEDEKKTDTTDTTILVTSLFAKQSSGTDKDDSDTVTRILKK